MYIAETGRIAEKEIIELAPLSTKRKEAAKVSAFPFAIKIPKAEPSDQIPTSHSKAGCVLTVFCINIHRIHSLHICLHINEYIGKHTINRG